MEESTSRSVEEIKKNGNRLKDEASEYLRQHAFNPVDWYPWGDEAIERARLEDKPIFLSVGYSSCHWCHVMEHQVFENDSIADYMNEHYVNIKVDREERPDIDAVYMEAVRALTNGGGWPMSVFLSPDLKPFYGGTYFPPDQFMQILKGLNDIYKNEREKVENQGSRLYDFVASNPAIADGSPVSQDEIERIILLTKNIFDLTWGGFRGGMKFPTPLRWHYLLHRYRRTGDEELGNGIRGTLDNMGSGGIHDHVAGGFHRYTVEGTWLVPHFEKMLYDNTQIASLYIEASKVWKDKRYEEIARTTLDFMITGMQDKNGGFYSSYDADSGGEEGTFYIWTRDEILNIAGEDDGQALAMLMGVTDRGNFEGKNILTRRYSAADVAVRFKLEESEVERLFEKYREKLESYRAERTWPGLDKKVITSWNGLAIAAMAQGYLAYNDDRYRQSAEKAAEYIWENHKNRDGSLKRSSTNGKVAGESVLDDYAFLANGFFELFRATGEFVHLQRTLELLDYVENHFGNREGAFFYNPDSIETPLGRQVEIFDNVEPSGNAVMLEVMLKVSAVTGNLKYRESVEKILGQYSDMMNRSGMEMAKWFDVVEMYEGPFHEIILAGDKGDKLLQDFRKVYSDRFPFYSVITMVPSEGIKGEKVNGISFPAATGKTSIDGKSTVYVCKFGSCKEPTSDPEKFSVLLKEGWLY